MEKYTCCFFGHRKITETGDALINHPANQNLSAEDWQRGFNKNYLISCSSVLNVSVSKKS